ncbi:hypothetical protein FO519_007520 [Halicephalobus sp. NKZ332]|nr:hypothetical protein FO519_007520 [Halicephalobus sp. NKZ332]
MLPNTRLLVIISLVSFAANWQFGYQITYINTASTTFYSIVKYAHLTTTDDKLEKEDWDTKWSATISSFYPGTFVGFIFVPFLVKRVGVKSAFLISTIPALVGCGIQLIGRIFAQFGEMALIGDLIIGRFLVGIHAGCSLCLLPLFTIESSPTEFRPFLSSLQQVFQSLATLFGLVIGSEDLIPVHNYRFEFLQLVSITPTILFVLLLWILPPTPFRVVDTISKGSSEDDLLKSLKFYYSDMGFSVDEVKAEAFSRWQIASDQTKVQELKSLENIKGLLIGCIAAISYAFTADDIIDSYSSEILYMSGERKLSQPITVGYGILLFITSIFGAFLIDKFGRKKLLIFGLLGTSLFNSFAVVGNLLGFLPLEIVGFGLTKAAIGLGAGAPAWFLTSELVSPKITELCQSISTGALLVASGLSTFMYLPLTGILGVYGIVVIAILPSIVVAVVLILFLPETKDKKHEEIKRDLLTNTFSGINRDSKFIGIRFRKLDESVPLKNRKNENVKYGSLERENNSNELNLF